MSIPFSMFTKYFYTLICFINQVKYNNSQKSAIGTFVSVMHPSFVIENHRIDAITYFSFGLLLDTIS